MNVFDWLTSSFSNRGRALSLYKRGMAKAKKHDHQGAIEDYSTTIGMPDMPADLMAMLLYNRALVHVAAGNNRKGADDLDAVLAMNEALVNVKTMARQKLAGWNLDPARATRRNPGRIPNSRRETCSS